jgi:hypothetical protein
MKNYMTLAIAALRQFGARTLVSPGSAVTAREAGFQADDGRGRVR